MILCIERISSQCLSGITKIKSLAENVIWSSCQKWEIEKKKKWEIGKMKYGMGNCTNNVTTKWNSFEQYTLQDEIL